MATSLKKIPLLNKTPIPDMLAGGLGNFIQSKIEKDQTERMTQALVAFGAAFGLAEWLVPGNTLLEELAIGMTMAGGEELAEYLFRLAEKLESDSENDEVPDPEPEAVPLP